MTHEDAINAAADCLNDALACENNPGRVITLLQISQGYLSIASLTPERT